MLTLLLDLHKKVDMQLVNKIEIRLEKFEKCTALLDSDCPLGQLYDFSCALKSFVTQKMHEIDQSKEEQKQQE